MFLNLPWILIENKSSKPFITSDNPVVLIYNPNQWYANTYVPISPKFSIFIMPDPDNKFSGKDLPSKLVTAGDEFVKNLNCEIIKSAERLIISNQKDHRINHMIRKYQYWRVETISTLISQNERETFYKSTQKAVESSPK